MYQSVMRRIRHILQSRTRSVAFLQSRKICSGRESSIIFINAGMQSEDQDSKRQRKDRDPLSEVWHKVHEKELSKYLLLLVTTFCCYVEQSSLKRAEKVQAECGESGQWKKRMRGN